MKDATPVAFQSRLAHIWAQAGRSPRNAPSCHFDATLDREDQHGDGLYPEVKNLPARPSFANYVPYAEARMALAGLPIPALALTMPMLAQSADSPSDEFLATASHELRTPIYGVLGLLDITLATDLTDSQRHHLRLARAAAASLALLTNDLLDLSKLKSRGITVNASPCDLHQLLEDVLGAFSIQAQIKGLQLRLACPAALPRRVEMDGMRFRQVLSNLVSNAIKFTSSGHVTVQVTARSATEGSQLRLAVRDTGHGISEHDLTRLFHPFTQLHGPNSGDIPNTGLGLTITRAIVEAMGGRLGVSSAIGEGTTFETDLPVRPPSLMPTEYPRIGARVCLALEDTEEQLMYAAWLQAFGCQCVGPEDADTADAAICDEMLSGSCHSLPRLRLPSQRAIPVIRVTETGGLPGFAQLELHRPLAPWLLHRALWELLLLRRPHSAGVAQDKLTPAIDGIQVLLVDDDPVSAIVSQSMLQQAGAVVTCVANGRDALRAFISGEFTVVVSDLRLPVIDGYKLASWFRRIEARRSNRCTLIAVSASATPAERRRCLEAGMDDFLAKPVLKESMYEVLLRHSSNWAKPAGASAA